MLSLLQRITSGKQSSVAHTTPDLPAEQPAFQDAFHIYFDLELLIETPNGIVSRRGLDAEGADAPKMQPGSIYRVVVWASADPAMGQKPVQIVSTTKMGLSHNGPPGAKIPDPFCDIDPPDPIQCCVKEFRVHEFEVQVTDPCESGNFTLSLFYCDEKRSQPTKAASLKVALDGTVERFKRTCQVALGASLPERTAILHVEIEKTSFRLTGSSSFNKPRRIVSFEPPPDVKLADFVEEKVHPKTVRDTMRDFSAHLPHRLQSWLSKLEEKYDNQLHLIIVDHTASDFPWEMIELQDNRYLGAMWIVVRWIPVSFYGEVRNLHISEEKYSGRVVAYLEHEELTKTAQGQQALAQEYEALNKLSTQYHETAEILVGALEKLTQGVGLVYLGCHGIFTYGEIHKSLIGTLHNPSGQVPHVAFDSIPKIPEEIRPIFFVNACHSARLTRNALGIFGLPDILLSRIARGYIGTLGPVGSKHAANIAKHILDAASVEDGAQIAEVLRQLRAKAVNRLVHISENATLDDWLMLLYSFMYIYYGNPLTQLQLPPIEKAEDKHE